MKDMKKRRLLPQSWCLARAESPLSPSQLTSPPPPPASQAHKLSPVPSSHARVLSLRHLSETTDECSVESRGSEVNPSPPPPPRSSLPRARHLREFLCSIETTPVRMVRAGEGGDLCVHLCLLHFMVLPSVCVISASSLFITSSITLLYLSPSLSSQPPLPSPSPFPSLSTSSSPSLHLSPPFPLPSIPYFHFLLPFL